MKGLNEPVMTPTDGRTLPTKNQRSLWWRSLFARSWKAAALATVLVLVALGVWRAYFHRSSMDHGLNALNRAFKRERPLAVRVTGISYAPHLAKPGHDPENVDGDAEDRAGADLLSAASDNPNTSTLHDLGRFYLMRREFDKAIIQFQQALKSTPDDAPLHADMGAAFLERAKLLVGRNEDGKLMEDLAEGHQHLSTALKLNPSLPEASFNKSLLLEEMRLSEQARAAWQKYIQLDSHTEWTKEAQQHLEKISTTRRPTLSTEQLLTSFTSAFRSGNEGEAWRLLSGNREVITGNIVSLGLAHSYAAAVAKGDDAEARDKLSALIFAGELDRRRAGDPYTSELANYYASASRATLSALSKAIEHIDQGYALCLATDYKKGLARFTSARESFEAAGDEWEAKLATYWIAYCLSQPGLAGDSITLLESLADFCEKRGYKWLLSLTTGWLGGSHTGLHDYSVAIKYHRKSLALAEEISDTYEMQRALMSLGDLYARLRQPEASLGYHYRNLVLASSSDAIPRQTWRNLTYFGTALFAFKYYDAAASVINEAMPLSTTEVTDPSLVYLQHLNLGQIYSRLKQFDGARAEAEIGVGISRSVKDPKSRVKLVANALLRQADIWREAGECSKAVANYDQAISSYEKTKVDLYRYAAYKGRLLCGRDLGDEAAIKRDLSTLLNLFEKQRSQIREEANRNSFFDAEQGVYDIAVEYEYEKANYVAAFNHTEASRSRSLLDAVKSGVRVARTSAGLEMSFGKVSKPVELEVVKQHMPPRLHVVMYTVLPTKLLIWTISRNNFQVAEKQISADALGIEVNSYVDALTTERSGSTASTIALGLKLFDTLLQPAVKTITSGDVVCIVPDKFLHRLPFDALISPENKYLVEATTIFYAPSLNVFWNCTKEHENKTASGRGTILSIGNPEFDAKTYPGLSPLGSAEREARSVSELYGSSKPLLGREATKDRVKREMDSAEIIHFAGHYVIDESSPLLSKMLLAPSDSKADGRKQSGDLAAFEIVSKHLKFTNLVVLSACQTGIDKYYDSEGPVGLARAFLQAGVPMVVASQWPVDSDVTADLMISFHRHRRSGLNTLESLRQAQVDVLHGSDASRRTPYYWAAFLCTGGYTEF
jgi:CHAT domain-containing protein/Flp pilus assembly protein TadD